MNLSMTCVSNRSTRASLSCAPGETHAVVKLLPKDKAVGDHTCTHTPTHTRTHTHIHTSTHTHTTHTLTHITYILCTPTMWRACESHYTPHIGRAACSWSKHLYIDCMYMPSNEVCILFHVVQIRSCLHV